GASYLAIKTEGEIYRRRRALAKWLWLATAQLLVLVSVETSSVRPQLWEGVLGRPLAWVGLGFVGFGVICIVPGFRAGVEGRTVIGGCLVIAGLLGAAAASLFPVMLHSTLGSEYSITAWNGSSDASSLRVAAYWWPVAFGLALVYFSFIAKHYRGRV